MFRIGHGDLLLTVPGGMLLVKDFFSADSAGIDRVVFDHAPAWTRDDLMLHALEAPPAYAHLVAGNETVFWGQLLFEVPDGSTASQPPDWHDTNAMELF